MSDTITKDWAAAFPSLGRYKPRWLLRRVGPLLQGILLERTGSGDVYVPTFHVHCLATPFPVVSLQLRRQLDPVAIRDHVTRLAGAVARMNAEAPLPLVGDLTLREVLAAYHAHVEAGAPYIVQALVDVVAICAWSGDTAAAQAELAWARSIAETWPAQVFDKHGGLAHWLANTEQLIERADVPGLADNQAGALGAARLPAFVLGIAG